MPWRNKPALACLASRVPYGTAITLKSLSQIERAESSASISSLYKIATALDVRIQDLFGEY